MANERLPVWISVLILPVLCLQVLGIAGLEIASNCSVYTFQMESKISWEESKNLCEQNGSKLVSMERLRAELNFLEKQSEALKMDTDEYYIGLRKNGQKWIWVSDNSTLQETTTGEFPWASGEPNGNGNCVKMWRQKTSPWTYLYDDVDCKVSSSKIGYICERTSAPLKCGSNEPSSKTPKLSESTAPSPTDRSSVATTTVQRSIASSQSQSTTKDYKPHTIKGSTTMTTIVKPTDKAKSSVIELLNVRESSTPLVPTSFRKSITPITYKNITAVLPEGIADESPDITIIILILLAVIILVVLIVFFLIFSRRRRNNKAKVSSSRKQSSDQTHHLHSSTELTVHFSMSQAREERFTIKTVTENNEEYTYAVVDENKRKSKCDQGDPSSSEGGEVQPSSKDEHIAADQSALKESTEMCDKNNDQEEKGRHVYPNVLVKENKTMFFKTAVSRDDGLDVAYTKGSSAMGKDPVEHLNRSSLEQGKEINSKKATSEQDPKSATDCNDHFYAAVDKSKKKRMAPKKPLPYCSGRLMYADMSHLPTNKNGKVHRACASTVYADINHSAKRKVKTGFKPRIPTM